MKKLLVAGASAFFAGASAFLVSVPAMADDCWMTDNKPTGWSVSSDRSYTFKKDHALKNMMICFRENDGTVTGTNLKFIKLGESTLIGWSIDGNGQEVVNVVQIDRLNQKLLLTLNRSSTAIDSAGLFTADVLPVANR